MDTGANRHENIRLAIKQILGNLGYCIG